MSGMTTVNWIAAEAVAGGDNATTSIIATALGLIHVLQVYTSCMMTLAVWDWLACLTIEWSRIWRREWSLIKVLYIWTRYYGLLTFAINLWLFNGNFTTDQCKVLHYLIAGMCMWVTLGSEMILAIRTYAFLGKKLWLGIVLGGMILVEVGYLLYVSIAGVYQIGILVGDKGPCTASDAPGKHVVSGYWLAPVAFDLICTFLTLYKAISLQRIGVKSHLVTIFLREGVLYFLAVSAVNVINAAFMFQSNQNIQNINAFLAIILSQVLCCRLVLNLRAPDQQSSHNESTVSANNPTFAARSARSNAGFNIPLNSLRSNNYADEAFGGVKVQVDVQRDLESDLDQKT